MRDLKGNDGWDWMMMMVRTEGSTEYGGERCYRAKV